MNRRTKLVVVDDDPTYRTVIRALTGRMPGIEIIGEHGDAESALKQLKQEIPDVMVIDWLMPGMNGLELVLSLRSIPGGDKCRVLLCTAHANARLASDLFALGVNGYVDKSEPLATLSMALTTILNGGLFFVSGVGPVKAALSRKIIAGDNLQDIYVSRPTVSSAQLSPREREVATSVANGLMSKEIAAEMGTSVRTVDAHRANLMKKIGVRDVASLTRWCMVVGLLH